MNTQGFQTVTSDNQMSSLALRKYTFTSTTNNYKTVILWTIVNIFNELFEQSIIKMQHDIALQDDVLISSVNRVLVCNTLITCTQDTFLRTESVAACVVRCFRAWFADRALAQWWGRSVPEVRIWVCQVICLRKFLLVSDFWYWLTAANWIS